MDRRHIVLIFAAYLIRDSVCQLAGLVDLSTDPAANTADAGFAPFTGEIPQADPPKDAASTQSASINLVVHDAPSAIGVVSGTESQSSGQGTMTFPDLPPLNTVPGANPDQQIPSQTTGAEISQLASELGIDLNFITPGEASGATALQQAVDQAFPPVIIDIPAVKVTVDQSGSPDSSPISGPTTDNDAGSSKFPKIATDPVQASELSDASLQTNDSPFPVFDGPIAPREMSQMPEVSAVPVGLANSFNLPSSSSGSAAFPAFEGVIAPIPVDAPSVPGGKPSAGGISVSLETGSSVPAFPAAVASISDIQSADSTNDAAAFPAFTGIIPDAPSATSAGTVPDAPGSPSLSDNLSSASGGLAAVVQAQEETAARRQVQQQVVANQNPPTSPFLFGLPAQAPSPAGTQPATQQLPNAQPAGQLPPFGMQLPPFGMPPGMMTDPRMRQRNTRGNTGSQQQMPGLPSGGQLPPFGMPPGMMSDPRLRFPPALGGQTQTPQANVPNAAATPLGQQAEQPTPGSANNGLQSALGQTPAAPQSTQVIDPRRARMTPPFFPPFAGMPPPGFPGVRRGQQIASAAPVPANPQNDQTTTQTAQSTDPSILPRAEQVLKQVQDLVNNLRAASGQQQPQNPAGAEVCPGGRPPVRCYSNPCDEVTCLDLLTAKCRPVETCDGCKPSFYVVRRENGIMVEKDANDMCTVTVNWNRQSGSGERRRRPTDLPASARVEGINAPIRDERVSGPVRGERIPGLPPLGTVSAREPTVTRGPNGNILMIAGAGAPVGPMDRAGLVPPSLRRLIAQGVVDPRIVEQQMMQDPRLTEAMFARQMNPALLDPRSRGLGLRERALRIGQGPVPGAIMLPDFASQIQGERVVLSPEAQLAIQQRLLQRQARPAIPTRRDQLATLQGVRQMSTGLNARTAAAATTGNDPRNAAARNELAQAFRQFNRQRAVL